jgi:hypothetical protein
VYDPAYEDTLRHEDALDAQGLSQTPGIKNAGTFPGANPYIPANTYYQFTTPQLKAAIDWRTIQTTLANHEVASQAGPGGIASGLAGYTRAWLSGDDPLDAYARGVERGAALDAILGMKADAINLSNMTAAQPYRPEIVLAPTEQPPMLRGAADYPEPRSVPGMPIVPAVPAPAEPHVGQRLLEAGRSRGNVNQTLSLGPIVLGPGERGFDLFGSRAFAEQVRLYVEAVKSNRPFSWNDIGLSGLDAVEREVVRMRAIEVGLIPRIPVDPRTSHADFSSVLIEERVLPEHLWLSSDDVQFRYLDDLIGGHIDGTTWHHHELPGWMQLLPFGVHNLWGHRGGRSPSGWADAPR